MKSALLISIYLGLISTLFYGDTFPANVPMFMQLDVNVQEASRSEARFSITGADTTIFHDIHLLYDQDSMPFIYYADILTPVCIDDICKPLYIELYWNLLGEYAGFGVYEAELLSKYDHDLFDKQDYLKLDHLLRNPYSILERKKLTDLYDPSKKRAKSIEFKGKQVDGITGATVREIKRRSSRWCFILLLCAVALGSW